MIPLPQFGFVQSVKSNVQLALQPSEPPVYGPKSLHCAPPRSAPSHSSGASRTPLPHDSGGGGGAYGSHPQALSSSVSGGGHAPVPSGDAEIASVSAS